MNHNEYKKLLRLSLFGEIKTNEQKLLQEHLDSCDECKHELEQQRKLFKLVSAGSETELDESILLEARSQLRGAIRNEIHHKGFGEKIVLFIREIFPGQYRLAASAVSLVLVGFFAGYLIFNSADIPEQQLTQNESPFLLKDLKISNINFIDSDPTDGEIEFTFDALKPVYMKGRVDDPNIQSILTFSMLNEQNPGARLNSINAMEQNTNIQFDDDVQDALITVALTDNNPGVRREALNLLKKLPFDDQIKQAYINVLKSDSSASLRIEAINALVDASNKGLILNKKELDLFKQKLQTDENSYVRYRTKTILQEYN